MKTSVSIVVASETTESTVLTFLLNTPYARNIILENLDSLNTLTIKFQESEDGGNTWVDIDDPDIFQIAPGEAATKQVINVNMVRTRSSGTGLLKIDVDTYKPDSANIYV